METNHKEFYEAPAITAMEIESEGVVCGSGNGQKNPYYYEPPQTW